MTWLDVLQAARNLVVIAAGLVIVGVLILRRARTDPRRDTWHRSDRSHRP